MTGSEHRKAPSLLLLIVLTLVSVEAYADYPLIGRTSPQDVLFQQHQESLRRFYAAERTGDPLPPLVIYSYRPQPDESLIQVASRFSISYSALASLNRLPSAELSDTVSELLIPSIPGIFVPQDPETDLERLMRELRSENDPASVEVRVRRPEGTVNYEFHPGADFDRVERLSFLGILFRRPVENVRISSHFGPRRSPFTGVMAAHGGVDFAAPIGTDVLAARAGVVEAIGVDPIMGNYVLLAHDGDYHTFYGHLDHVDVRLNDKVSSGSIIGAVGNTGLSTGSHLHFEVRLDGIPRDPLLHLPGLNR
ncbi:MAG: M23 family metallopeptidase [Spirochaetota bacterium]